MSPIQIELGQIAELSTQVALHGAVRMGEVIAREDLFELIVGIAVVIYEMTPGG